MIVLVCFSFCLEHHDHQQLGDERVYLTLQVRVHHGGKPEQELKAGNDAETGQKCCSLACSSGKCLADLFYTSQDHLLKSGIAHSGLCHLTSIIDQENAPMDVPQ